jgi:iron(III) transport system permease protein
VGLFLAPLGCIFLELLRTPSAWSSWNEFERVQQLAQHSAFLTVLTLVIAVPIGIFLGILLERFDIPTRRTLQQFLLLALFLPLPVYAVAWQAILGEWLPTLSLEPGRIAWRPWKQGMLPTAWIHGVAAIPWVAWIVGSGLRSTVQPLEDDARIFGGMRALLRWVILPRAWVAAIAAAVWVGSQTFTEITVTDAMMVRTFAEEVYTQLVANPVGVVGALALSVPVWCVATGVAIAASRWFLRKFFADETTATNANRLTLGPTARKTLAGLAWIVVAAVVLLPLVAILAKAGLTSQGWRFAHLGEQFERTARLSGVTLAWGILSAIGSGLLAAAFALGLCWITREKGSYVPVGIAIVLAFTPGPILGFGLKSLILFALNAEDYLLNRLGLALEFPPMRSLFYDQPSPLPGIWACAVRFFPVAVAVLYPVLRLLPREQLELAKLDGVSAWRCVAWPLLKVPFLQAALAVGVLSLGEVSTLVVPPHWNVYILDLFNQMHYGTEATVATMCLMQVGLTAIGVFLLRAIAD